MLAPNKTRIVVDEDNHLVERIDNLARVEGVSRSDILRRAIRNLLFSLPNVSENRTKSNKGDAVHD